MSNPLSVRRVKVQTIDEKGEPEGEAMFGVMAADSHAQTYNDTFATLEELNVAIDESPSILSVADDGGEVFPEADHSKIGHDNFYGKHWSKNDEDDDLDDEDDRDDADRSDEDIHPGFN